MTSKPSEQLSEAEIENRLDLFKASAACRDLRKSGFKSLGRHAKRFTVKEWTDGAMSRAWDNPLYMEWRERMRIEAERAGLAEWVVELVCMVKNFDLGDVVRTPAWPKVTIVSSTDDPEFLRRLLYWSSVIGLEQNLNIRIACMNGDEERGIHVPHSQLSEPDGPLDPEDMPTQESALSVRLEFPPSIPSDEIIDFARRSRQAGREILRRLGYAVPGRQHAMPNPATPLTMRVVASTDDPGFVRRFVHQAGLVGAEEGLKIQVAYLVDGDKQREVDSDMPNAGPNAGLDEATAPPREKAISVQVEFRPSVSSREITRYVRRSRRAGRELLTRLGYSLPVRERSSGLTRIANQLRLHIDHLHPRGIGAILDETSGTDDFYKPPADELRRRRSEIKSNRHRLLERSRRYG